MVAKGGGRDNQGTAGGSVKDEREVRKSIKTKNKTDAKVMQSSRNWLNMAFGHPALLAMR